MADQPHTVAGQEALHAIDMIGEAQNLDVDMKQWLKRILAIEADAYEDGIGEGIRTEAGARAEADALDVHPRTYSLTASGPNGELFLVTDDESGITIGHARKIGGPLTAPAAAALDVERLAKALTGWKWPPDARSVAAVYARLASANEEGICVHGNSVGACDDCEGEQP